jgi:hypothetical protein
MMGVIRGKVIDGSKSDCDGGGVEYVCYKMGVILMRRSTSDVKRG